MPLYGISVQKGTGGNYWTNKYYCEAADFPAAENVADEIVAAERASTLGYISFISWRVSLAGEEDPSLYVVKPLTGFGNRSFSTVMPLTVCARVLLSTGPGRPSPKFYRGMVQAGDYYSVADYSPTFVALMQANVVAGLEAIEELTDESGNAIISIFCSPKISQHQLTRGTKKKTQPVIPVE